MTKRLKTPYVDDLEAIHDRNIDAAARELYLVGESDLEGDGAEPGVEHVMASRLIANLRFLTHRGKGPILIHMKTCGGDWQEGMAIYDAIKTCPCTINILSYTHARSMSSIILQAADYRILMPHSIFMYHLGSCVNDGDLQAVYSDMDFHKKTEGLMLGIYTQAISDSVRPYWGTKTGTDIKRALVSRMQTKTDVYLTSAQAVDQGFADEVFDGNWDRIKGICHEG